MLNIRVTINGLEGFADGVRKAPQLTAGELSKAVQKSVLQIQNQAIKEAPVNKGPGGGNLRQNIRTHMISRLAGVIEALAPYSLFVHEGTAAHTIVPVNKKVLADRRTGQIFGTLVHHPGTRPNPFFARAIERSTAKIEQFFNTALFNILKVLQ